MPEFEWVNGWMGEWTDWTAPPLTVSSGVLHSARSPPSFSVGDSSFWCLYPGQGSITLTSEVQVRCLFSNTLNCRKHTTAASLSGDSWGDSSSATTLGSMSTESGCFYPLTLQASPLCIMSPPLIKAPIHHSPKCCYQAMWTDFTSAFT